MRPSGENAAAAILTPPFHSHSGPARSGSQSRTAASLPTEASARPSGLKATWRIVSEWPVSSRMQRRAATSQRRMVRSEPAERRRRAEASRRTPSVWPSSVASSLPVAGSQRRRLSFASRHAVARTPTPGWKATAAVVASWAFQPRSSRPVAAPQSLSVRDTAHLTQCYFKLADGTILETGGDYVRTGTLDGLPPHSTTVLQGSATDRNPIYYGDPSNGFLVGYTTNGSIVVNAVPEPSGLVMLGVAALVLVQLRHGSRRRTRPDRGPFPIAGACS